MAETDFTSKNDRSQQWQLQRNFLSFEKLPLLMGIVNVTPDSFSDGGKFYQHEDAIQHGLELVKHGAHILDIGGESTRPGSETISDDEQLRRVIPVITALNGKISVPISIDTSSSRVAREAIDAGAQIVNDVTALTGDYNMIDVVGSTGVGVCLMHMQGSPRSMQTAPKYENVVLEVYEYLKARRDVLVAAGISPNKITLDPGIGFGKTTEHNIALLKNAWRLHSLGCPLLIGPSRKSFIGNVLNDQQADRLAGTIGVVLSLASQGVQIVRVHDIKPIKQSLQMFLETATNANLQQC